ncbi:uncharacterized protein [Ptychodera flava]|uniref:uncharacterized protein n=1 Tax=Ptychodera flava TaxID=63121 RepID=UPI003969F9F7
MNQFQENDELQCYNDPKESESGSSQNDGEWLKADFEWLQDTSEWTADDVVWYGDDPRGTEGGVAWMRDESEVAKDGVDWLQENEQWAHQRVEVQSDGRENSTDGFDLLQSVEDLSNADYDWWKEDLDTARDHDFEWLQFAHESSNTGVEWLKDVSNETQSDVEWLPSGGETPTTDGQWLQNDKDDFGYRRENLNHRGRNYQINSDENLSFENIQTPTDGVDTYDSDDLEVQSILSNVLSTSNGEEPPLTVPGSAYMRPISTSPIPVSSLMVEENLEIGIPRHTDINKRGFVSVTGARRRLQFV